MKQTAKFSHVLIAGGAGFIGSHLADKLSDQQVEVTVLDNLSTGKLENLQHCRNKRGFKLVKGDVRNARTVKLALKDAEAVFNDAAIVSVPRSLENPMLANDVNAGGALNLLTACLNSRTKRFIQASSASIYGNTRTLPVNENTLPNPLSPYAVAELAAENYAKTFHHIYGLETVCLRYFNVYGPRQTYSPYSGAVTIFLNQLLQNKSLTIFGDGNQTRDFIYVEDIIQANLLALNTEKANGETFNIATGTPHTINELVNTLKEKLGKQHLTSIYTDARPGDIKHSYANIDKAEKTLRYNPKFPLDEGIKKLAQYYSRTKKAKNH